MCRPLVILFSVEKLPPVKRNCGWVKNGSKPDQALESGGDRLQACEQKLSQGKHAYSDARENPLLILARSVFNGGKDFTNARSRIGSAEKKSAAGKVAVSAGERRLDAGQAQLSQAKQQLSMAENARVACGLATIFLVVLSVALGLLWRRPPEKRQARTLTLRFDHGASVGLPSIANICLSAGDANEPIVSGIT